MALKYLQKLIAGHEEWLMQRTLEYAQTQGYTRYTSTLLEAWRISISGLSASLLQALEQYDAPPELFPETDYRSSPMAEFAVIEAQRHRERGVPLEMFLGLMKYFRRSYLDLAEQARLSQTERQTAHRFVERYFDHLEIAFCAEWARQPEDGLITELQQANRQLVAEKARYLTMFESSRAPMFYLDRENRIDNLNEAAMGLFDVVMEPGAGYYSSVLRGEQLPWLTGELEAWRTSDADAAEFPLSIPCGPTERHFQVQLKRMRDVSGTLLGTMVVMNDVSQLRQVELAARESEQKLQLALEGGRQATWEWWPLTGDCLLPPRFFELLGYPPQEPLTTYAAWVGLLHPDDQQVILNAITHQFATNDFGEFEYRMMGQDGAYHWLLGRGMVVARDDLGHPLHIIGTNMDVTDRKHHEQELAEAYGQLKAAQSQVVQQEKLATIGQLAAGIAHEINNPVGFIQSNLVSLGRYIEKILEYLRRERAMAEMSMPPDDFAALVRLWKEAKLDYVTRDITDLITESRDGIDRIKGIVQDLKSFSRKDCEQTGRVNLNDCLDSTINLVWNEIKHVADLQRQYGDIPPVAGNPQKLSQVFLNLMVNAVHAMEGSSGTLCIRTWEENGTVMVTIRDTGHGIPAETQRHIFEPFFTTKDPGRGTGLGLSIVNDIIAKHGGTIAVESTVGTGTMFTIALPAQNRV